MVRGPGLQRVRLSSSVWRACMNTRLRSLHSETRIITTLFGILFWDIIFLPIPGAFETPFQTAPLDITEDAFYHARRDAIEARLQELEDGRGEDIVKRIEAEHRERKTWCVGVDWTLLEEGEMVEIVRVSGSILHPALVTDAFAVPWRESALCDMSASLRGLRWAPLRWSRFVRVECRFGQLQVRRGQGPGR